MSFSEDPSRDPPNIWQAVKLIRESKIANAAVINKIIFLLLLFFISYPLLFIFF
jgi:hypothetical protein